MIRKLSKTSKINFILVVGLIFSLSLPANELFSTGLTIKEKREQLIQNTASKPSKDNSEAFDSERFNRETKEIKQQLRNFYEKASLLNQKKDSEELKSLLKEIKKQKRLLEEAQRLWVEECQQNSDKDDLALWHSPETTIYNLVLDYGKDDCVYLIPREIGNIKLSTLSCLPIPKECWEDCLEKILSRFGIGIKRLSPILKELCFNKPGVKGFSGIFVSQKQLMYRPSQEPICYILSPHSPDVKMESKVIEKFINTETLQMDIIGGRIFIFGSVEEVLELLKLYDFIKNDYIKQDFRLVVLKKILPQEMMAILQTAFRENIASEENSSLGSLKVIPLTNKAQTLFLTGNKVVVDKAIDLIQELEGNLETPEEKTIFWYNVKHSDSEELATLLFKVYESLSKNKSLDYGGKESSQTKDIKIEPVNTFSKINKISNSLGNFIVDPKTGTIICVIEQDLLPHIKALLKKLDVPKKMVQIEVLLFERKVSNQKKYGLNLLRIGEEICQKGLSTSVQHGGGLLDFILTGSSKGGLPGYDLAYQFLMGQEDIQINASPSIMTMNQTPATIAIVEEMSIAVAVDQGKQMKYNRAQYGITIQITPTINLGDQEEEDKAFITLDTDINFDTTSKNAQDRPDVTRRHITNHVCIANGETVILGGLRRKNASEQKEGVPFLGEVPGLGKLFSMTTTNDNNTEMFIFITPKIVADNAYTLSKSKSNKLENRPGDTEDFIRAKQESKKTLQYKEQQEELKIFADSMKLGDKDVLNNREYDGR